MGKGSFYFREREKISMITRIILSIISFIWIFLYFNVLKIVSDAFEQVEEERRLLISMIFYLIFNFGMILLVSAVAGYIINIFLHYILETIFSFMFTHEANKRREKGRK